MVCGNRGIPAASSARLLAGLAHDSQHLQCGHQGIPGRGLVEQQYVSEVSPPTSPPVSRSIAST
jgi:hypothetical protein